MTLMRVDGLCMNFCDRGQGHPILFVHGFPLNHTMWRGVCDRQATNFRIIAPDLRGFGESEGEDSVLTMEQFADDLALLLDALGVDEPVTFCGLSMGGYIAWQFLRKYPEMVDALVLCNTRAAADTPETAEGRHRLAEQVLAQGSVAAADAMVPKLFAHRTFDEHPERVEAVRRMILGTRPETIAATLRGLATRPDMSSMLPTIEVPVLLIVGDEDRVTPPDEMWQMSRAMPAARLIEVPGSGHLTPVEQPRAVCAALERFLAVRT